MGFFWQCSTINSTCWGNWLWTCKMEMSTFHENNSKSVSCISFSFQHRERVYGISNIWLNKKLHKHFGAQPLQRERSISKFGQTRQLCIILNTCSDYVPFGSVRCCTLDLCVCECMNWLTFSPLQPQIKNVWQCSCHVCGVKNSLRTNYFNQTHTHNIL